MYMLIKRKDFLHNFAIYNSKLLMSYLISATILHIMFCVKIAS